MTLDTLFVICAIGGGALFAVQLGLQLAGFASADADIDLDGGDSHSSPDASFKVLSLQGLTAFFLMFGLIGLATLRSQSEASFGHGLISTLAGLLGGITTTWLIAKLFGMARQLQSSGTLDLRRALDATGTVYLTIRSDKPGKVTVVVAGRSLTLDAHLAEGQTRTLETGASVVVTRVLPDDSVEVRAK